MFELILRDREGEEITDANGQVFESPFRAVVTAKRILRNRTDYDHHVYSVEIARVSDDDMSYIEEYCTYFRPNDCEIDAYNYVKKEILWLVLDWIDDKPSDVERDAENFGHQYGFDEDRVLSVKDGWKMEGCFTQKAFESAYIRIAKERRYAVRDRETGAPIDYFASVEEAEAAIESYESDDEKGGCYTPDFYEVYDTLKEV